MRQMAQADWWVSMAGVERRGPAYMRRRLSFWGSASLLLWLCWILAGSRIPAAAPTVTSILTDPSGFSELYDPAAPSILSIKTAQLSVPYLDCLEQSSCDLSIGMNEQRENSRRIRRTKTPPIQSLSRTAEQFCQIDQYLNIPSSPYLESHYVRPPPGL